MTDLPFDISEEKLAELCRRWKITELAIFGSALREDFGPESDVDVLVAFAPDAPWSYWDWPSMQDELSALFGGRSVDLVERRTLRNPFIRHRAITTRRILYAA
ncbi:MAG: DNA polymerase subunit beta [Phycisphaeraceae bacterium]|nr:MAG: DNA polymerase subunit beta [Phycisphaeraceae bacterium]